METATIRIPEEKKNLLKAVASLENKKMNDLIVDLIDEYVARRRETLEIMSVPGLYESIRTSSREFRAGKSVSLKDARNKLVR
jgi:PHD/YefM family antitoxin component YafN of YafNO toxin-antitoxin module